MPGPRTRFRRTPRLLLVALSAAAALIALPHPAMATIGTGADISSPQCGTAYPAAVYGIVGVNNTTFADVNPCLASEFAWAQGLGQPAQAYLLAADPGPGGTFWNMGGSLPCDGSDSVGCAYDYGQKGAESAMAQTAPLQTAPMHYWIDVERGGEPWQEADPALNAAELQGEIAGLEEFPGQVSSVGIYTRQAAPGNLSDFAFLVGAAKPFTDRPFWLATGPNGNTPAACQSSIEAAAPITQAQSVINGADVDVICPPRLTVSSVRTLVAGTTKITGTAEAGSHLTITVKDLNRKTLKTLAVTTAASGRWSASSVPFTKDARLTVTSDKGSTVGGSTGLDLRPIAEVHVTGGVKALGGCEAIVHGVTAQWWSGQTIQLRVGHRSVGSAAVHRASHGGTWSVTVPGACGRGVTVVPYVDGKSGNTRVTEASTSSRKTLVRATS